MVLQFHLYQDDLPPADDARAKALWQADIIAVDTETQGLKYKIHRLCLVQLSAGDGVAHLVQLGPNSYDKATNLKALLSDKDKLKLFHFARFDVGVLNHWLGLDIGPIYCTKIASKLVRTYGAKHSLANLVQDFVGITLEKEQQSSDWAKAELSQKQLGYAAGDVLYLHQIKAGLDEMLRREGRSHLAQHCFEFMKTRVGLDDLGFDEDDIFAH